jgi:phytanoyl-CoA hydroxylase
MKKISKDQKSFFLDQGYLILENILDGNYLSPVINELNHEIDKRARILHAEGALKELYANESFETRLARISSETPKLAVSIWNGILHGPGIFQLITAAPLIDVMEDLVGPEIIASSVYRLRPKIPNFGYGEVPWHQDSAYFEPFCDNHLIITAWVPLVDSDIENGCMYVIPGSHKNEVVGHKSSESGKYLEIEDQFLPRENWVACPVKKGGVLLLTNKVFHASFKNSTDKVRWSMDLRYQSAALPTNASIDRLENEIDNKWVADAPASCFPPEADFLVRSKNRSGQVIRSYEEFNRLRETYKGSPVTNRFNVQWKELQKDEV